MLGETLDRVISVFSPQWGLERTAARATLLQIESFSNGKGGYDAGKLNRLTKGRLGTSVKEHAIPSEEIERVRWQAWNLYRNNPHARKIVRAIQSQVVGRNGLRPASTATLPDGTPDIKFRTRAAELWQRLRRGFDFRGMPGSGGLTTAQLQRLAIQSIVLSGELLFQFRPIDSKEQKKRGLPIPLTLQLVDAGRLANDAVQYKGSNGNDIYRGIEIDSEGRRLAYHIRDTVLGATDPQASEAKRIAAEKIRHIFIEDDIDQYRGVSWFASSLLNMRDTGDLQYNELKASAMAACVVLGYKKPSGKKKFGLQQSADADTVDDDGNPQTALQPGMLIDLGDDGKLDGFNPMRPGNNVEPFIQHMLRGTAAGFPGVKSSTLTGDYRRSSFSSERSADNDAWPELECVQEWFSESAMQPIWEAVLVEAFVAGWFEGIVTPNQFISRRANYLGADWQGPVGRSINPTDDADAAGLRVKYGQSTPQIEAAAQGRDWQDILRQVAEFYAFAEKLGLPEEVINNMLSVDAKDVTEGEGAGVGGQGSGGKTPAKAGKQKPNKDDRSAPPEIEEEDFEDDEVAVIENEEAVGV